MVPFLRLCVSTSQLCVVDFLIFACPHFSTPARDCASLLHNSVSSCQIDFAHSQLYVYYSTILDALEFSNTHHAGKSDWCKKRCKQWQCWSTETILSLLVLYTSYLEALSSLQSTPLMSSILHCHAACQTKMIK